MEQFKQKFIEEAHELIALVERELLTIDENPEQANVEEVFRPLHTLKGASAMFGFNNIQELTHNLETIYDDIRNKKREITKDLINITFQVIDHIKDLLHDETFSNEENVNRHTVLLDRINRMDEDMQPAQQITQTFEPEIDEKSTVATYLIVIKPDIKPEDRGLEMNIIFDELRELGYCFISQKITEDEAAMPYWELFLSTNSKEENITEILLFLEGEYQQKKLASTDLSKHEWFIKKVNEVSERKESLNFIELKSLIDVNITEQKPSKPSTRINLKKESTNIGAKTSIRVSSDKLDILMNLVSELVTIRAELDIAVQTDDKIKLEEIVEKMDKLTKLFRDNALDVRLVPIESMMLDFKRLIRDISKELGKEVEFVTEGTETELDKTIIENLKNPLMHILRNCLDHGIESAGDRITLDKNPIGQIKFKAYQSGNNVYIAISDDGRGIDIEKIKQKAIIKGFVGADKKLTLKEIYDLIFLPGFSTAYRVTEVSGRGVGMDVVKKHIGNLNGEIEISSEINKGTSFIIKLPLTLSIIDTLMVKVGKIYFLLPLSLVDTCNNVADGELSSKSRNMMLFENVPITLIHLRELFKMESYPFEKSKIVIIKNADKKVGVVVDEVLGEHQAVLKPLGDIFRNQRYLSGGSIMGDGSVALVLDTGMLIRDVAKKETIIS